MNQKTPNPEKNDPSRRVSEHWLEVLDLGIRREPPREETGAVRVLASLAQCMP